MSTVSEPEPTTRVIYGKKKEYRWGKKGKWMDFYKSAFVSMTNFQQISSPDAQNGN